jgi:ribosomal protein S18 acetylase RimI-like enzyme
MADISPIAVLVERYWEFEAISGFDRSRIEALLKDLLSNPERGAAWIAENTGRMCGYLTAAYVLSVEHGGLMAEIDEFFVLPDIRSAGVGSLLLAEAQRDMAARGIARLQLQLDVDNQRGRAFYQRHGFRRRARYELFDKSL